MNLRPRLVYLDNNAIGSLYEPRQSRSAKHLADLRTQLAFSVRNSAVTVVVSLDAFEEYAPVIHADRSRYLATLDYLQWRVNALLIAPPDQLIERELRYGRKLLGQELGFDQMTSNELWRHVRSSHAIDRVLPATEAHKRKYHTSTVEYVRSLRAEYARQVDSLGAKAQHAPTLAAQASRINSADFQSLTDTFSSRVVKKMIENGKAPAEAEQLPIRSLPSIRHYVSYSLGRTFRNVGGAKVKESDAHDHDHYVCARYTDKLVTDDREFRETCRFVDPSFDVSTFDEFFANACSPVVSFGAV